MTTQRQQEARLFPRTMLDEERLWYVAPRRLGARAASLPIRFTVEAHLGLPRAAYRREIDSTLFWTLREIRERLYPAGPYPKTATLIQSLRVISETWNTWPAFEDWVGPRTGAFGRMVTIDLSELEGTGLMLDVVVPVHVRPIPERLGPLVSLPRGLSAWGVRSAPAYNLLLMTAGPLWSGEPVLVSDVARLAHPASESVNRSQLKARALRALARLVAAGLLKVEDGRILRGPTYLGDVAVAAELLPAPSTRPKSPERTPDPRLVQRFNAEARQRGWRQVRPR